MILADIVALAKAGYSYAQVKELMEIVETSPSVQEAKPEEVNNLAQNLQNLENVQTNTNDPEVQLGAFAKLAKENQ